MFAFVFITFSPPTAEAAISIDSTSSATTGSNTAATLTWSHTVNGTDRILLVGVSINTNTVVSSVQYGGLPLNKITALENGNSVRVSLWYMINPPIGSQAILVSISAPAQFVAGAHSYTGVHQQIPLGTPVTSRGNGTSASILVPSAGDEMTVDVIARRGDLISNAITAGSEQQVRWNARTTVNSNTTGVTGGGSSKTENPTATIWSWPSTRAWAVAATSIKPATTIGDTIPPIRFNGLPTGTLPYGTTQSTLSLETDENAVCRYSHIQNTAYEQMTGVFDIAGNTTHTKQLTDLSTGSSYVYHVRCVDTANNQNNDDFIISFSIDTPPDPPSDTDPPTSPNNLTVTTITFSQINLTWNESTDDIGIAGYKVFRNNTLHTMVSENSFQDTDLSELTMYTYEVLAFDAAGNESQKSLPVSAVTPAIPEELDTESPTAPDNLSATAISSSVITLSWSPSTDNIFVAGYNIFRDDIHITSVINNSYTDTGLTEATEYIYMVSAIDPSNNESARSNSAAATTFSLPPPPDSEPPLRFNGQPSGILPLELTTITLSLATDEAAICKYSTDANLSFDTMSNVFSVTGNTIHEQTISGLNLGMEYTFYVRCNDIFDNANMDDLIIQFSIESFADTSPPTTPENLSIINVSSSHISFSWTPSSDNIGVTGYKLFRDDAFIGTTQDNEYSDSGLLELTTYSYRISAYDDALNESEKSSTLLVTTSLPDSIPPIISNIFVTDITSYSAIISWHTDKPATSRIEYGFSTLYGASQFNGDFTTDHSIQLFDLSGNATYNFFVQSTDGSGNTIISTNEIFHTLFTEDTVPPAAITDLSTTDIGQTFLNLSWTAPGDDDLIGQANQYDIRYLTSPIIESNWDGAIQLTGEPTPALAGTIQQYLIVGLTPGTKYYFAIRSIDGAGNTSALSNIIVATALTIPPLAQGSGGGAYGYISTQSVPLSPSDFQAISAENQVKLQWLNPTDENFVRVVVIRKEFSVPRSLEDGKVVYEGDKEEYIDTDVINGILYYYGIFAYDRIPNYSEIRTTFAGLHVKDDITELKVPLQLDHETDLEPDTIQENTTLLDTHSDEDNNINMISLSPDIFQFNRALTLGMNGTDVGKLQEILSRNNYIYPQGIVSHYFGELTRMAVRKFQCAYGVVCFGDEQSTGYGRVGPKTVKRLNDLLAKYANFVPQVEFSFSFGAEGDAVKLLQQLLSRDTTLYPEGHITGIFGDATRNAVKKFQCLHEIVCSGNETETGYGKIGPKTTAKINQLYFTGQ